MEYPYILPKQIGVCAHSAQFQFVIIGVIINQQPVWCNMTFPQTNILSAKLMWTATLRKRPIHYQHLKIFCKLLFRIASFGASLIITLKSRGANYLAHSSVSSASRSRIKSETVSNLVAGYKSSFNAARVSALGILTSKGRPPCSTNCA